MITTDICGRNLVYEYPYNHINRGVNKHINNNLNYKTYERF